MLIGVGKICTGLTFGSLFFALVSCTNPNKQSIFGAAQSHSLLPSDIGEVGTGAVPSQSELASWTPSQISSCAQKIGLIQEERQIAHPSNFGKRDQEDFRGQPLGNNPRFIVIHETVMNEADTIRLFKTNHPNDDEQASYHLIVARDGRLIRIVPDDMRAFGAGMSHVMGNTLKAKRQSAGSINNIALHISLVSPEGFEHSDSHTGYTDSQYKTLAGQILKWQMKYGIPMSRVTTHYAVDRSHSRYDPRSFHWDKFDSVQGAMTGVCNVRNLAQPA